VASEGMGETRSAAGAPLVTWKGVWDWGMGFLV
jgi:hypothetical protein